MTSPGDPQPPPPAPGWHVAGENVPPQPLISPAQMDLAYPPAPPPPLLLRTTGWVLPSDSHPSRWPGVGTIIRRTATVFASAPRAFLTIALLGAIPGIVGVAIPRLPAAAGPDPGLVIMLVVLALVGGVWALVVGTMTTVATAHVATGRQPQVVKLFNDLDRPVISAIVATLVLLVLLAVGTVAVVALIVGLVVAQLAALTVVLLPVGLAVAVIAFLRTSLMLPAVVLETRGGLDALRRSWGVTHRLTWHLFGYSIAVGLLLGLPVIAVQATTLFVPSPIARLAVAVLTAPVGVLGAIGSAVLFGHLVGRPWNLPDRVPRAVALTTSVAILCAVALVGAASIAVAQSPFFTYLNDRTAGQVQFGTSPAPTNTCHVGGQAASFGPDDPIYVSAVFIVPVANGASVTRQLSRDGIVVSSGPVAMRELSSCYIERAPLDHLTAGAYRLTFRQQQLTIADGQFVLQAGTSTRTSRLSGGQTRSG